MSKHQVDPHSMEGVERWLWLPQASYAKPGHVPTRKAHLGCSFAGAGFRVACGRTRALFPYELPDVQQPGSTVASFASDSSPKCGNCLRVRAARQRRARTEER